MDTETESVIARDPVFLRAVDAIGGYTKLAEALGLTKANVWNWGSRRVPAEYVRDVVRLSNGAVTVHELRPDVFGERDEEDAAA